MYIICIYTILYGVSMFIHENSYEFDIWYWGKWNKPDINLPSIKKKTTFDLVFKNIIVIKTGERAHELEHLLLLAKDLGVAPSMYVTDHHI